ncbi:MAG: hypothetical protein ISQ08_06020 [Planctomycetes bacterium]|nr:hypothetical protein [Planctomycetota bacterium]
MRSGPSPSARPARRPTGGRCAGALAALLTAVALLGLGACATPGRQEIHLAPLWSDLSLAGGDREVEALGGAAVARWSAEDDRLSYWALRPLVSWTRLGERRTFTWILPPLGSRFRRPEETVTQVLPLWHESSQPASEDRPETFQFFSLPGVYLSRDASGRRKSAFFVFYGDVEEFLSFDRAQWVLFPLFARFERRGRTQWNLLFPMIQWSTGEGGTSWRVWPLAGDLRWEGRYRRRFLLWPFLMVQESELDSAAGARRTWQLWPLFGWSSRGEARSWTALWPFFGLTTDERTGFWAWDGPWPLVVFQGGDPERSERQRVWPFYSHYRGDGLDSTWLLWPLYNRRSETYAEFSREAVSVLPFWSSWDRTDRDGRTSSWRKLWPIMRRGTDQADESELIGWPALNPLPRQGWIDEHYAWMWELYAARRTFDRVRVRSWLGLYREETDRLEQRRSIAGLWARRDLVEEGRKVREVSLLFGLLRARREGENGSFRLLAPAFPGPGWPRRPGS